MKFNPQRPFNDLPLLPPKKEIETAVVLRRAITASRALAELKGLGETIPDQALLINTVLLQEAKASSEIENVITTNDSLFEAITANTSQVGSATKEVLRYREALWNGYNSMREKAVLSTNLFIKIVQTITKNQAGIRRSPGTNLMNPATDEIVYTPPEGELIIRDKLKNLEEYIHEETGIDPLIKLSIIHYQFEAIHPFSDGNGRTGRIINILFLVLHKLLDLPVLYLSHFIIEHKSDYYRLLRKVTEKGDWESWILYMLEAIEKTAHITRRRILDIRDLMLETMEDARRRLPSRVYSKELIEILFRQPYTKGSFLVDGGIAKRQTAADYLKEVEKIGILKSKIIGKETLYLNIKLYNLLSK